MHASRKNPVGLFRSIQKLFIQTVPSFATWWVSPLRRSVFAAFALSAALVSSLPGGAAAPSLAITDLDLYNEAGDLLTRAPLGQPASLKVEVKNVGPGNTTDPIQVVFHLTNKAKNFDLNRTIQSAVLLKVGETTNVTLEWTPTKVGEYTLESYVVGQTGTKSTLEFTVAESEVLRGSLTEFSLQYLWFFAAFVAVLALFAGVRRARGPPG